MGLERCLLEIIESKMSLLGEKWENVTRITLSEVSLAEASWPESKRYTIAEFKNFIESGKKIAFYIWCKNFLIYKDRNLNPTPTTPHQLFHVPWVTS